MFNKHAEKKGMLINTNLQLEKFQFENGRWRILSKTTYRPFIVRFSLVVTPTIRTLHD